jgi:hypothetical protein
MRGILRVAALLLGTVPPAAYNVPERGVADGPPWIDSDLFAAMRQQLGLRLQASKGMVDVIVIDRVERP